MKSTALLIDGNALIHRAWHALPRLTAPDGRVVNAVYGFSMVLLKILQTERPDYLVVCWDTPEPTYRHKEEPAYKAQREEQPQEFYEQVPIVKDVVAAFGGRNVERPGYEADDLLATAAKRLAKKNVEVTILTSDRDAWQIIGPNIRVMAFKKGVTETVIYDEKTLPELTGLKPRQITDYKAMSGDASDNLKGIPGIGEKTALDLLQRFGTLEQIFVAAKDAASDIKPGARQKLIKGEQAGRKTLHLVELDLNVPMPEKDEDFRRQRADEEQIREMFLHLGFKTLLARTLGKKTELPLPPLGKMGKIEGVEGVLAAAKADAFLIISPIEVAQESLFADQPAVAFGSKRMTTVVSKTQLGDAKTRKAVSSALADGTIKKIGHDLKLAWHWCRENGFELNGISFDTEIAAYLLSAGERSYDLPSLAAGRFDLVIPEGDAQHAATIDAIRTLHGQLSEEIIAQRLDVIMDRFEIPLIPILGQMEDDGILIDRAYFKTVRETFQKEKTRLEKEMTDLAGEAFNPASPLQLARILFDVLKIPTKGIKRGKTGFSTAASELEKLDGVHPIIEKIGDHREVAKLLSTYVEALPQLADADGRIHTTYNQTITSTGRLSSTEPNLQNIPIRTELGREIRRGFVAKKGFVLLSCDYSQIELRIIAALAKDTRMTEAFLKNVDIHTATAAAIWDVPLEDVTKEQRRSAKAVNFGIIYGQGPQGLAKSAGVSFEEARHFIDEYFHVYSGIREYLDQTKAMAHAQGYVETLFGRRRPLQEINSPMHQVRAAAERMAINMPVQGTAADILKLAMIEIAKQLPTWSKDAKMLLQVHDELVFEVREEDVVKLVPKIKDVMETVEKIGVPLVVEAKQGTNWDEMIKIG